ncbi:ABC transporter ATP-binding protein [Anatilimnocola floriformis]|uniref:ABC transporter ATP-binding protein n=1 Tax=Anatilimnocola floriformis TaxID=2948575 RepID=UPI0020C47757|nr:ABC transporter ATP-binding protein [Anatilimnocola floriformis]
MTTAAPPPKPAAPLLEVRNLATYFHTETGLVRAVDNVNLSLDEGKTLGIVGESGSGKSVTSYSIMRLLAGAGKIQPGSKISFLGRDLVGLPEREMRQLRGKDLSMIFQEPMTSLNPVFTVGAQVMEAIRLHNDVTKAEARQRTIELFREVGMPDPEKRVDSYPHQMSGGQKQRVMIAMALSCNPKLLIADEPTTALDVTIQAQILDILRRLRDERGMSVLFITHDLGVIAEIADDVAVMLQGKVVEYGKVLDIFSNPQHPYTKGLLACKPRLNTPYKILPTVADFMETSGEGDTFKVTAKTITPERLQQLTTQGRGRLLHPRSELQAIGHPWEESQHAPDTKAVLEGEQPLLSVKDLKVHFPVRKGVLLRVVDHVRAVDGISFNIYRGQTLGLVGESGCGKTTAGRAILRLIEPDAGQVTYAGVDLKKLSSGEMRQMRRKMQIIFQDPYGSMNPRLTIEAAITEPMVIQKIGSGSKDRRDRAVALLEEVGLKPEHLGRYPHEFSGGQRQRICIARCLAVEPEFIVCDESVSALDVSVQAQVLNLLKRLQEKRGLTYIFISHDLSVVKFMADMMAVMQPVEIDGKIGGRIVEFGPSENIYANPKEKYTRKLIDATPNDALDNIRARQAAREAALVKRSK